MSELEHLLSLLSFQEDIASQGNEWVLFWKESRGKLDLLKKTKEEQISAVLKRELWARLSGVKTCPVGQW